MDQIRKILGFVLFLTLINEDVNSGQRGSVIEKGSLMDRVINTATANQKKVKFAYWDSYLAQRRLDSRQLIEVDIGLILKSGENTLLGRDTEKNGQRMTGGRGRPPLLNLNMPDALRTKFNYDLANIQTEVIDSKTYYVVSFRSKPIRHLSPVHYHGQQADYLLEKSRGKIYIDPETNLIWKVDAELYERVGMGLRYFEIYTGSLYFEQQIIDGIAIEKRIEVTGRYKNGWGADPRNLTEIHDFELLR